MSPSSPSLAIACGVKVSILGADTRTIDGKSFGTMLLGLPDNKEEADKAIAYIKKQPNITMEEVNELSWMNFSALCSAAPL